MDSVKVCVAMSGGVDSSVAATLLVDMGYTVGGAIMRLNDNDRDIADARAVAEKLDIGFDVIDCRSDFEKYVIDDFVSTYIEGRTPNPCVVCNRKVKFGAFMDRALALGYDMVATGHYARLENSGGRILLKKALDESKDQSYVLYGLSQDQLAHVLFPLGEQNKSDVRTAAREELLPAADRPDSQDICFIKDGDHASYIEKRTGKASPCGVIRLSDGTLLGRHNGIIRYTVGQRRGLGVSYGQPLFVVRKNAADNSVILGTQEELYSSSLIAEDVNFIPFDTLTSPITVTARTRYRQKEAKAVISPMEGGRVLVEFETPQKAVCAGQSVVFYDGEYVVGGGIIAQSEQQAYKGKIQKKDP